MVNSYRGRAVVIGVAYLLLHVALDAGARLFEVMPGVSLWYPPVGIALALVIMLGPRWLLLVLTANLYTALLTPSPYPVLHNVLLPTWIALCYGGTGVLVRKWFGPVPAPIRPLHVGTLAGLMIAAPMLAAGGGTAMVWLLGAIELAQGPAVALKWAIGDLTGVITVVPLCLVHITPWLLGQTEPRRRRSRREKLEILAQVVSLLGCIALVHAFGELQAYRSYYLCFIPLIWISLRHGLAGAALANFTLTLGALASLRLAGASQETVADILLFLVASTTVGLGLGSTVTRRARAESERSRLLEILEASPDFIATLDLEGNIRHQNAAFIRLRGGPTAAREAIGQPLARYLPASAASRLAKEGIPGALGRGIWQGELTLLDAQGHEIPVVHTLLAHHGPDGQPTMLSMVARDMTAERRAERSRLEAERNLLQSQKLESLGVLAGGIAHDFNNLLTVVIGNATLARLDTPADSPAEKAIHQIELAAIRAAELCRQMLAYSGRGQLATTSIDLTRIVEETTHLLKVSISKKCTLAFDLARELPPVRGDATQLNQIAMNLVINASDASGDKGGRILVRTGVMLADRAYLAGTYLAPNLEPGSYVYLEVSDQGVGMSPDVMARVFEPFFTTKPTGHGLGLSAVLGIARSHHGAIRVDSQPGVGTTFRLLLPAATENSSPVVAPATTEENWHGSGRVLLVDDEEAVRDISAKVLERLGFTCTHAGDGRAALACFEPEPKAFCAVLLDLTMPVLDGEQTLRELRRIDPEVPVVLMSGYSRIDATKRFRDLAPDGFLQKPFTASRLSEALHAVLPEVRAES